MSYWGKASLAKMTSPGGKQAAMPHHPTKKANLSFYKHWSEFIIWGANVAQH